MPSKSIRIGGASGFWGDAPGATAQLLASVGLDFIVYDYLAEITMSIMARARARDPAAGYATDFVTAAMAPNLPEIQRQGVKIVANAGGVNPLACARALRALIAKGGHDLKVACVMGDDLLERKTQFAADDVREMFCGDRFPAASSVQSINAYLGAFPIAQALDLGADIVVTGRCVDSAVTLGACIHSFGWQREDYDKLALGSLAGHLIECGPQATGGNFTDWERVADQIDTLGYPVAQVDPNGRLEITKPAGSGGLVSVGTVAEQLVYEIGDPQAYLLPDVCADFSTATLEQAGADRVRVAGATGRPPTDSYKVSTTYAQGFRGGALMTYYGLDADKKARAQAAAILRACRRELNEKGLGDFAQTSVEIIGAESQFGAFGRIDAAREVVLKVAVKHERSQGVGVLLRACVGLGLATPPGLSGFQAGRPKPSPVVRLFSFLVPKSTIRVWIDLQGEEVACAEHCETGAAAVPPRRPEAPPAPDLGDAVNVPLLALAWGRSGDKGNNANIGIVARKREYLPYIWSALDESVVSARLAHFFDREPKDGRVERFLLPGCGGINFLVHDVLGGGGVASLRSDPQGKGFAQLLMDVPVAISKNLAATLSADNEGASS